MFSGLGVSRNSLLLYVLWKKNFSTKVFIFHYAISFLIANKARVYLIHEADDRVGPSNGTHSFIPIVSGELSHTNNCLFLKNKEGVDSDHSENTSGIQRRQGSCLHDRLFETAKLWNVFVSQNMQAQLALATGGVWPCFKAHFHERGSNGSEAGLIQVLQPQSFQFGRNVC
jgi:hypothetical protein